MAESLSAIQEPWKIGGNLDARVRETHTGVVILLGDKVYKVKKSISTDFLDFSTPESRENACAREVALNRRLARESYLGVAHFIAPHGEPAEPVIVMRRYADSTRLATMVRNGVAVDHHLRAIAEALARFHRDATRSPAIDAHASVDAVAARWEENLDELRRYPDIPGESVLELRCLATQFMAGRGALFARRINDRRIVDGHADLLADDIFCGPEGLAILDCLEFDDDLRYVDTIDDAAFLAMDLEFLGSKSLGDQFLDEYSRSADDPAPRSLKDFYIAYRAVVRAKVDCVRSAQGHPEGIVDARRHIDIALEHLQACTVRVVIIGGGPGTGKTTVARALAEQFPAQVISTDDVRRDLQQAGQIDGRTGELNAGLYSPENVAAVYDEVLRRAARFLTEGTSVILDGTWRDPRARERARRLAAESGAPTVEFTCFVPLEQAAERVQDRPVTTSDATPEIAVALASRGEGVLDGHRIDTSRPLADSIAEVQRICRLAIHP